MDSVSSLTPGPGEASESIMIWGGGGGGGGGINDLESVSKVQGSLNTESKGSVTTEGEGVEGEGTEDKGALKRESEGVEGEGALRRVRVPIIKRVRVAIIEYGG